MESSVVSLPVPKSIERVNGGTQLLELRILTLGGRAILTKHFEASSQLQPVLVEVADALHCPQDAIQLSASGQILSAESSLNDLDLDTKAIMDITCVLHADILLKSSRLEDFTIGRVIHPYSFGKRKLAVHRVTGTSCMIDVRPSKAIQSASVEQELLGIAKHPFILNLYTTFQDESFTYMVLEFAPGGDLFKHLRAQKRFSEDVAQLFAGMLMAALEHLHAKDIVYRNIKPENCLVAENGYLRLLDFSFAKCVPGTPGRTFTVCGTPEYLAPEVVANKGHGKPVDWWSLGVIIYEMLTGFPPFVDESPMMIYQKILRGSFIMPEHFSDDSKVCLKGLLNHSVKQRWGATSLREARFFQSLDWALLLAQELPAPQVECGEDSYDQY